ncbi:hypothetical protein ACF0H5_022156 [Mactra antiquata]
MKLMLTVLSLTAIIGVSVSSNVYKEVIPECSGNTCKLCRSTSFKAVIDDLKVKDVADYQYHACFIIEKTQTKIGNEEVPEYSIEIEMKGESLYKNTYQKLDKTDNLPCIEPKKKADDKIAKMCPYVYDVDLKKDHICVKFVEMLDLANTQLEHEVNFGCAHF